MFSLPILSKFSAATPISVFNFLLQINFWNFWLRHFFSPVYISYSPGIGASVTAKMDLNLPTVIETNFTSDYEDALLALNSSASSQYLSPSSIAKCERLVETVILFTRLPNYVPYFVFKFCVNILGTLGTLLVIAVYWNRAKKHQRLFLFIVPKVF